MKSEDLFFHSLKAISPIDGRHHIMTKPLGEWFSEYALFKYRVFVEVEYLISLSELDWKPLRKFSSQEKEFLRNIFSNFSLEDAQIIQNIDRFGYNGAKPTNHDVKSVEYFLKMKIENSSLKDVTELVHFGLTSEDINNIALDCMLRGGIEQHYLPALVELIDRLAKIAETEKSTPMLSKTHGQPATPTTFGKELANFVERLRIETVNLKKLKLPAKLNGAVGSHNAQVFAAPEIDWIKFAEDFIKKLGFEPNLLTTQIESHDGLCRLFSIMTSINNILRDMSVDFWLYISQGYLVQQKLAHEVGSSTMPHKINPWRMEVAEGSSVEANAKFSGFIWKLQASRLQRDLSDHEAQRAVGVGIAHSFVCVLHIAEELSRIQVNRAKMFDDLKDVGAILTEGIQTLLRKENYDKPYELMKELSRGQHMTPEELYVLVDELNISDDLKVKIKSLRPENYIGVAEKLTMLAVSRWKAFMDSYEIPLTKIKKVLVDCDSLTYSMIKDFPQVSSELQKAGVTVIGVNASSELEELFTTAIKSDGLEEDREAMFIGVVGDLFNEASKKKMLCVNLEEVSGKRSEYNIVSLGEIIALMSAVNK